MANTRIALTGFMGVGKTSVARHLANALSVKRLDLDQFIENRTGRKIPEIIDTDGEAAYRALETKHLLLALTYEDTTILSLGGGVWTIAENRDLINQNKVTSVWLESTFEHCWQNIRNSKKERPLARNRDAALKLFEERQKHYCLADLHIIIRPELTSYDIAQQIKEQLF